MFRAVREGVATIERRPQRPLTRGKSRLGRAGPQSRASGYMADARLKGKLHHPVEARGLPSKPVSLEPPQRRE